MSRPDGDSIADQVRHHLNTDTNIADVAQSLTDAHSHRPGLFQQDLAKTNAALHEKGMLPGLDIVGVRGQDLVTRDKDGHTHVVDATNVLSTHEDKANGDTQINGRKAHHEADGSGTVQAKPGDNRQWALSQDVLKAQGIDHPTPNQMANFQIELERLNGKPVSQFKPGDQIKVPASAQSGDQTEFVGERADKKARQETTEATRQATEANDAITKFSTGALSSLGITSPHMNKDDISTAMQRPDLTPADARGLKFLSDHYDQIADSKGVYGSGIDKWQAQQAKDAEQRRVLAYMDFN